MLDWHNTQDEEYLSLLKKRVDNDILNWVQQFIKIINSNYLSTQKISINDIGCNVGHFCNGINLINNEIDYCGYDISETYLSIARNKFRNLSFEICDASTTRPRNTDVTIISATLEHVHDHDNALKNIFESTKELLLIRTFLGEKYLEDLCQKKDAKYPYVIKQFSLSQIEKHAKNWSLLQVIEDESTKGIIKNVCSCGESPIFRQQKVLIVKR